MTTDILASVDGTQPMQQAIMQTNRFSAEVVRCLCPQGLEDEALDRPLANNLANCAGSVCDFSCNM